MQKEQSHTRSKVGASTTWVVRPDRDLADLIPSFLQNRRVELEEIDRALVQDDFEFIRRMAHTWKGICRPYGFSHLDSLSRCLEEASIKGDKSALSQIASEMREYIENVRVVYDS